MPELDQITRATATYIRKKLIDNVFGKDPLMAWFTDKPKSEFDEFRDWVAAQRAIEDTIGGINGT